MTNLHVCLTEEYPVKKRFSYRSTAICCVIAAAGSLTGIAQRGGKGDWSMTGADAGQNGYQKAEEALSPDSISGKFKFLWKIQLGKPSKQEPSFTEPLLAMRLINAQGFKDIVYWGSQDTLYAVDSELGDLIWKKHFEVSGKTSPKSCPANLGLIIEPPPVINFNARRRPAGTPPPPEPPPAAANARRLGVAPGGGYFGLKGIYVLTGDGMLHEQVLTTGADFAPAVKFLPSAGGSASGLNIIGKRIYTATGRTCGGVPNGEWAIDISSPDYPVKSYKADPVALANVSGPVIAPDGTSFIVTGEAKPGTSAESHPDSIVAIDASMNIKDWYTPPSYVGSLMAVSPVTFNYKGKQLLVAPEGDGSLVLLDAASLGGSDHHTPLFKTPSFSAPSTKNGWSGLATWQDTSGDIWIYASVSGKLTSPGGDIKTAGSTEHGGVIAFKLVDSDGKVTLSPAWISADMVNPAPPRLANGVLVALAGGDKKTHATLHVLNAATGAELYTSKDEIPTYTHLSGVAIGDSHAFFTDHNNVLYSFGLALEH
jgi:outer membrane protein assembly factor BamB